MNFDSKVSVDTNQGTGAVAWDMKEGLVHAFQYRMFNLDAAQFNQSISFTTGNVTATSGSPRVWNELRAPSVLLGANGTVSWLFHMSYLYDSILIPEEGLFFARYTTENASWSEPVLIKQATWVPTLRHSNLIRLNATHLVAFWEANYTVYYRVSPDGGLSWGSEETLFPGGVYLSTIFTMGDGRIGMSLLFSSTRNGTVEQYSPYIVYLNGAPEQWEAGATLINSNQGGLEDKIFVAAYPDEVFLLGTEQSDAVRFVQVVNGTLSRQSALLDVSIPGSVSIVSGLHVLDEHLALCFLRSGNNRLTYSYLQYFDSWGIPPIVFPPEVLFVIVVGIILGVQVVLFLVYKYTKQRGSQAPDSKQSRDERTPTDTGTPGATDTGTPASKQDGTAAKKSTTKNAK